MKIEIELPNVEGFEYTGEYRIPKDGEWYQSDVLGAQKANGIKVTRLIIHKLTLEDRVNAEYSDYEVVMLKWSESGLLLISRNNGEKLHVLAQSMRGFYKYVYEIGHILDLTVRPVLSEPDDKAITKHPIAVLFTKAAK